MADILTRILEDITERVMTIPEFVEKCEVVLSEKDLTALLQGAKCPMAGIVYVGISNNNGDSSKQGISTTGTFTVLIIIESNAIGGLDQKPEALRLLAAGRRAMLLRKSPAGNKWVFQREGMLREMGDKYLIYGQTWTTEVNLTYDLGPDPIT